MKKLILWLVIIAAVVGLILIFSQTGNKSKTNSVASSASIAPAGSSGSISVSGWIVCLPRLNADAKCLVGIEDPNNSSYALLNSSGQPVDASQYETGQKAYVSGLLMSDPNLQKDYNFSAAIQIMQ